MACIPDGPFDVGIVGGGQLGRMLALAAAPLGLRCCVLDPDPHCSASQVADVITGPLDSEEHLRLLAQRSRVTTFEIEHTNPVFLRVLESEGTQFAPGPAVLGLVADKLLQKRHFAEQAIPVPEVLEENPSGRSAHRGTVIQKSRFGGYDGRGVARVSYGEDFPLPGETFVEAEIPIQTELAVVVARNPRGELRNWEPVEMVFDPALNLVSSVVTPARIDRATAARAVEMARAAAEALAPLGLAGVLAVELFLDERGVLLLNEVAPRPHNSAHLTIESSQCSQFEQHLRAVLDLPLGETDTVSHAAMVNLLGSAACHPGEYTVAGLADACAIPDVHVHLYQKRIIRPGRKMGHVTARADTTEEALRRARRAAGALAFVQRAEGETK